MFRSTWIEYKIVKQIDWQKIQNAKWLFSNFWLQTTAVFWNKLCIAGRKIFLVHTIYIFFVKRFQFFFNFCQWQKWIEKTFFRIDRPLKIIFTPITCEIPILLVLSKLKLGHWIFKLLTNSGVFCVFTSVWGIERICGYSVNSLYC